MISDIRDMGYKSYAGTALILLLLISVNRSIGQTAWHITGKIVDENKQGLPSANVVLTDNENKVVLKALTDINGTFELQCSVPGQYMLAANYIGYKEYRSELFQLSNKDFGLISLHPATHTLGEVVVQSKQNLVEFDANSIVYNVSKNIDAQGVSAFDALKKAPGIYIDNDNSITLNGKSGAMILLDGKQTYLSGKELADLLKSMPSSGIKSIEIMNSPSAKYDAAGAAGIINIKTNKSKIIGFNGSITTGVTYGATVKHVQDLSFNYRKNKYNIYGSYNHFLGHRSYVYGSDRFQKDKTYDSFTDDTDKRKNMGSRLGFDYDINKKNTIGILINSTFIFGGGFTDTKTDIGQPSSVIIEQVLNAQNDYYHQLTSRYNVNANYKYEDTLGRVINVDADYGLFNKGNRNLQSNTYTNTQNNTLSSNLYRSLNDIDINLKALKFDYTTNFLKGKLETGAKYSDIVSDNNARFFHALANGDSLDNRRTNAFQFTEQITSGYVNYKKSVGKWSFQAGLRMENSSSDGSLFFKLNGINAVENITRNYTNFFPSFSASVKPKDNHGISIAYSRRIDRPAYQDLNPFIYLLDELSFWQGNPFLQPQLTHRASLQYVYKSTTIIGVTFSHTNQYSTRITDTLEGAKIVMIPRNLGVQENLSLSLTQMISPVKWWDLTFNGILYQTHNKIAFDQFRNFNLKQVAGRMNLQQTFKLPNKITAEISGSYNSKKLIGANEISRANSQVDVGMQRKFMNNRATVRIVFNDIYKGNRSDSFQNFEDFSLRSYGYYESRQIRLNFTYKFADGSVKGPRTRNSALENENGRIR